MTKTLILLAHPNLTQSRLNKTLIETLQGVPGVTVHDLYGAYATPDAIDVAAEQRRLLEHERIVFQFPLYWYSTPGLLKDWQDRVLEYGFAYGSGGDKLSGKGFRAVTTTGGPEAGYAAEGATIADLFKPLQMMAAMTRMEYAPPFATYGALQIGDAALAERAQAYRAMLLDERW